MTKRLQVLLDDAELDDIQRAARRRNMTTAEWVRQNLRRARETEAGLDPRRKLELIRHAATFSFPTADIEQMNAEIEQGYLDATE